MNALSNDSRKASRSLSRWAAAGMAALALTACGDGDGDAPDTVVLADSGTVSTIASSMAIPTTVAVRDDVAWVVESQFDQFPNFGGAGMPTPFRLVGISLDGSSSNLLQIALPANFYPEGITVTEAERLYVGSAADGAIVTVNPRELTAIPFVAGGALRGSVLGLAADLERRVVWACVTDFAGNSVVTSIAMDTAEIATQHALPGGANDSGALCNDIVVAPSGAVWITESFGGRLFVIPAARAEDNNGARLWLEADALAGPNGPEAGAFGVNGLELLGGRLYVVNAARGTLLSIDPTLSNPTPEDLQPVVLNEPGAGGDYVLAAPDGMARFGDNQLLIVENGFGLPNGKRLLRVRLDLQ